jgi:hypothetical protein
VELLNKIYWIRVALGAVAGLISAGLLLVWQSASPSASVVELIGSLNTLLNGVTIALFIYLLSYYVLKSKYSSKVEKQSKIMTMGIFIYFFTWIIVWVLTITLIIGPIPAPA